MFQEYPQPTFSPCMHRHIQVITKGKMHFSAGEVWDDLQDQVLCLDCLCTLTEREIRESWGRKSTHFNKRALEK